MEKIRVATVGELEDGTQKFVTVQGRKLYLTRVGGAFFASDCNCPCPLSGGVLNRITDHGGAPCVECDARCYTLAFDLRTGGNTRGEDFSIRVFPARVENDAVFVEM